LSDFERFWKKWLYHSSSLICCDGRTFAKRILLRLNCSLVKELFDLNDNNAALPTKTTLYLFEKLRQQVNTIFFNFMKIN